MKTKDKSIKVSPATYKLIIGLKKKSKMPIKYVVENAIAEKVMHLAIN